MIDSIKVKIIKKFPNPLTSRRTEIGQELNVPKNQFWLKRLKQKDCELIEKFTKAKPVKESGAKAPVKINPKGSK